MKEDDLKKLFCAVFRKYENFCCKKNALQFEKLMIKCTLSGFSETGLISHALLSGGFHHALSGIFGKKILYEVKKHDTGRKAGYNG